MGGGIFEITHQVYLIFTSDEGSTESAALLTDRQVCGFHTDLCSF